jgi:hypothetical protein
MSKKNEPLINLSQGGSMEEKILKKLEELEKKVDALTAKVGSLPAQAPDLPDAIQKMNSTLSGFKSSFKPYVLPTASSGSQKPPASKKKFNFGDIPSV